MLKKYKIKDSKPDSISSSAYNAKFKIRLHRGPFSNKPHPNYRTGLHCCSSSAQPANLLYLARRNFPAAWAVGKEQDLCTFDDLFCYETPRPLSALTEPRCGQSHGGPVGVRLHGAGKPDCARGAT
jgi:hypothetical protein